MQIYKSGPQQWNYSVGFFVLFLPSLLLVFETHNYYRIFLSFNDVIKLKNSTIF